MVRRHGRNAQIYLGIASSAAVATPIPFQAAWSINQVTDRQDVTAFGDSNKIYVAGLPDSSGDFSGFLDNATSQTFIAAADGLARNFYLYWDATNDPNSYFYGTVLVDAAADGAIGGPVSFKATWSAASKITRYTSWGGMGT